MLADLLLARLASGSSSSSGSDVGSSDAPGQPAPVFQVS
jgi:hypothetical protein